MSYSLRGMLVIVGLFALAFAFGETLWPLYLIVAGPLCGAVIERIKGGDGIRGGVLAAMLCSSGLVIFVDGHWYNVGSTPVEYFVASLGVAMAALFGSFVGLAVGCVVKAVADTILGKSARQENESNSVSNASLFDLELPKMSPED